METTDELLGGIMVLVWYAVVCTGAAGCLRKSGRPAWKGFVPILNAIEICQVAGLSGWLILLVFVPVVNFLVSIYVALRLAHRFGASDLVGLAIGLTGFLALPWLGFGPWQRQESVAEDVYIAELAELDFHKYSSSRVALANGGTSTAPAAAQSKHESRIRMIVLSVLYTMGLLSIPGLLIIGTMAFGGASQAQVDRAGAVAATACLVPFTLLIAFIGGWLLHVRHKYLAATALVALPMANLAGVLASLVWVFAK